MNTAERIEHQKWAADTMLDKLYSIDPFAIVAGGAPRDWTFGKLASDIDIFFHCGQNTLTTIDARLESVGVAYTELKLGGSIPEWYKRNPHLKGVYCLEIEGVKVQLMRMDEPTFGAVLPHFPLSICHTWYKNKTIHLERHFKRSVKHKAIYKTSEIYNDSHAYIEKILKKFPEYKYYTNLEKMATNLLDAA